MALRHPRTDQLKHLWQYGEKLRCPPEFIAVMLRDIADAFDEQPKEGESSCECF